MATPKTDSSFICYNLSQEEEMQGRMLSYEQELVIQNEIAVYAEEKVALVYDVNKDPIVFAVSVAALDAKLEVLKFLLMVSQQVKSEVEARSNNS